MIPYTQHTIQSDDIASVVHAFTNGHLATGHVVGIYEQEFAFAHGYAHGVAFNSGTSALWCAYKAMGVRRGDDVVVSPLTFAATVNMIVMCGARPVFADVDAEDFNVNYNTVTNVVTKKTRLVVPVDFGGQVSDVGRPRWVEPCSFGEARMLEMPVVVDAAHSVGVSNHHGVIRCYSTHAAKNMTTCEGGVAVTDDADFASAMRVLRNHGITTTAGERKGHRYTMPGIGFNFRLADPLAALGLSQLTKLSGFNQRRAEIRAQYDAEFNGECGLILRKPGVTSNHLYVVLLDLDRLSCTRDEIFRKLRAANIGVNVHYRPVYLFRHYRRMGYRPGLCPNAEWVYERCLTLPLYPGMHTWQVEYTVSTVKSVLKQCLR